MWKVKLLYEGLIERSVWGDVLRACSTITYLTDGTEHILVDIGHPSHAMMVLGPLRQVGLTPETITKVVITHIHRDHVGNRDAFVNARFYVHEKEGSEYISVFDPQKEDGRLEVVKGDDIQLDNGLKLIHTPGHSWGSMSLVVEGFELSTLKEEVCTMEDGVLVIAGDAVPNHGNIQKDIAPLFRVDKTACHSSLARIREMADVVITGHQGYLVLKKEKQ